MIVPSDAFSQVSPLYPSDINIVTSDVVPSVDLGNWRPRIGFAYRLGDGFVIRGGYGSFSEQLGRPWDSQQRGRFSRAQGTGPFEISETYYNTIQNGQPFFSFPNPFPDSLEAALGNVPSHITSYPMQTDNGTVHQFNLSIERQIGDIGLRTSYVGSRGRGLNYSLNINKPQPSTITFTADRRPYPQFVDAFEYREDGQSNYDSLQLEAKRRVGAITFNANYTWAGNLHNFLNTENTYDVTSHWARDDYTQRHRAVVQTMIELPWGRGRRYLAHLPGALSHVIGGWTLITISYFATGQAFSPVFSGQDPSGTNTGGGLPDRIADGNLPRNERTIERWFDPSALPCLHREDSATAARTS